MEGSRSREATLVDYMKVKGDEWQEHQAEKIRKKKETAEDQVGKGNHWASMEEENSSYGGEASEVETDRPGGRAADEENVEKGESEETAAKHVYSIEEDPLVGQKVGYQTDRRPVHYQLDLSTEPWAVIREWFKTITLTIGATGKCSDVQQGQDNCREHCATLLHLA